MAKNKLLVINVLASEVYNDCRIKGSINVPNAELKAYVQDLDRETSIVVYCASYMCSASRMAWQTLNAMGFKNLWAYEGGTNEWFHNALPTEGACSFDYLMQPIKRTEKTEVRAISVSDLREMMKKYELV